MRAMVFETPGGPLVARELPRPAPRDGEILIRVKACAVCRTDLHIQANELPDVRYPIVPGHQVVGEVVRAGAGAVLPVGATVGAAWLGQTCNSCDFCKSGRENLCDEARFHGYHVDGGYAEYMRADARYCFPVDPAQPAAEVAPLLCGGLIGYRGLRMAGAASTIGLYGFGSAAHIISQVALRSGVDVYAFVRPGDAAGMAFAKSLGCAWAGGSDEPAPAPLDAALIFAPDGALVTKALRDVRKGGRVICAGIHMSDIPSFPYADLWGERQIRSVANLTRRDGAEFMALVEREPLRPDTTTYPLAAANDALGDLRSGALQGTAVLLID